MTNTSLRRRPARVVPATIAALAVTAIGAALAVLGVLRLQDGRWLAAAASLSGAGKLPWGAPGVAAVGGVAALLGLVLLLSGLLPGRTGNVPTPVPAADAVESAEAVVTRRGVEQLVENRIRGLDGVGRSRARLRGNRLRLSVGTPLREHRELAGTVTEAADGILRANLDGRVPTTSVRMVSSS
ncbi:DUF6286 domain-containing protein [Arthrobacter halodurans]|uniref:DUF6286 domain-containing protein n=1 Tax=Arthrobacter halodurans TaxID=516699 RepID=A0ABV4UQP1_9MICC